MALATQADGRNLTRLRSVLSVYAQGAREPWHVHEDEGQLKWPGKIAWVRTPVGLFVLPASFALWIPANQWHGGIYPEAVRERSLYVHVSACNGLPPNCCAVPVQAQLEEAFATTLARGRQPPADFLTQDLATVELLRREIADAGLRPLSIELPTTSSVQPVIDALLAHPQSNRDLASWAVELRMSPSTFSRAFHREVGTSFGNWRKRVRVLYVLQRLAAGVDVSEIAAELGYRPSAMIQAFRSLLDTTPGKYFPGQVS